MSADAVEKKEYLLTFKFKFSARDDVEARSVARDELVNLGVRDDEMENVKLQRLVAGAAPEKVEM